MMTAGALYYAPSLPQAALGEKLSWAVRSDRYRDTYYTVTRYADGRWECDCPGFRYEARADKLCKHVDRKKAEWELPPPDFPELA